MKDAQQEIKSTVTVNTSDIAAKAHEDKEQSKEIEKISKKRTSGIVKRYSNDFHLYLFTLIASSYRKTQWDSNNRRVTRRIESSCILYRASVRECA